MQTSACYGILRIDISVSVKVKLHFDADLHIHWPSILKGRLKAPLFDGFKSLSIQTEAQPTRHSNVARMPGRIDDQP